MRIDRSSTRLRALFLSFLLVFSTGCLATSSRYVEYFSPTSQKEAVVGGRDVYYHPSLYDEILFSKLGIRIECRTHRATVLGIGLFIIPPVIPFPKSLGWCSDQIELRIFISDMNTLPRLGGMISVLTPEASISIPAAHAVPLYRDGWRVLTQLDPRSTETFTLNFLHLTLDGKPAGIPEVEFKKRRTLRIYGD